MKETYCIVDKRVTPCTEPSGYQQDKRGRTQFFCRCAVCGNKKVRYVKMGKNQKKLISPSEGAGVFGGALARRRPTLTDKNSRRSGTVC